MKVLLCAVSLALASPAFAAPPASPAGKWKVTEAKDLGGKAYEGVVAIEASGKTWAVRWNTSASKLEGVGLYADGHFVAVWGNAPAGAVLYKIGTDGTLLGTWTSPMHKGQIGTETGAGGQPGTLEGTYHIVGRNPGGGAGYQGQLIIKGKDNRFTLEWRVGRQRIVGVGVRQGDVLGVAFGVPGNHAVAHYTMTAKGATGIWTQHNNPAMGKEVLARTGAVTP